ncbi:unnamed protein product [Closterium sp. Naga37s-1]|nr:unnamed protein product [Closterium sp. Naga37s-1]
MGAELGTDEQVGKQSMASISGRDSAEGIAEHMGGVAADSEGTECVAAAAAAAAAAEATEWMNLMQAMDMDGSPAGAPHIHHGHSSNPFHNPLCSLPSTSFGNPLSSGPSNQTGMESLGGALGVLEEIPFNVSGFSGDFAGHTNNSASDFSLLPWEFQLWDSTEAVLVNGAPNLGTPAGAAAPAAAAAAAAAAADAADALAVAAAPAAAVCVGIIGAETHSLAAVVGQKQGGLACSVTGHQEQLQQKLQQRQNQGHIQESSVWRSQGTSAMAAAKTGFDSHNPTCHPSSMPSHATTSLAGAFSHPPGSTTPGPATGAVPSLHDDGFGFFFSSAPASPTVTASAGNATAALCTPIHTASAAAVAAPAGNPSVAQEHIHADSPVNTTLQPSAPEAVPAPGMPLCRLLASFSAAMEHNRQILERHQQRLLNHARESGHHREDGRPVNFKRSRKGENECCHMKRDKEHVSSMQSWFMHGSEAESHQGVGESVADGGADAAGLRQDSQCFRVTNGDQSMVGLFSREAGITPQPQGSLPE